MGYLRFFLALNVIFMHAHFVSYGIGGRAAVEAFFVLSGLYMAAVYDTKYSAMQKGVRIFYLNRFLRLYPTYLFLLVLTGLCYLAMRMASASHFDVIFSLFASSSDLPLLQRLIAWTTAFTILGQDFQSLSVDLHYMLPVRQSWSIATEFLFYLSVPLLFRIMTWKRAMAGAVIFLAIKAALFHQGERLSYFLPVGNFAYFLFGYGLYGISILPHVAAVKALIGKFRFVLASAAAVPLLSLGALLPLKGPFYALMPFLSLQAEASFEAMLPLNHAIMLASIAAISLLLFDKSPKPVDHFLANISYGVYLNHLLLLVLGQMMGIPNGLPLVVWTAAVSLVLSFLMEKTLQEPIDRYRRGFTALPAQPEKR